MTPAQQFADAIRSAGLAPPENIVADGKLRRFATNGRRGDDSGWYIAHGDGIPAGAFGCWRSGISEKWRADIGRNLTPTEEAAHQARMQVVQAARDAEEAARRSEARQRAEALLQAAAPADGHPYLERKRIKSQGLRVHDGALVVPMRDADNQLHSLQFIGADGEKRYLTGGRVAGCYFSIGKPNGLICVVEGYATGASIFEATGHAVAVAFDAGNLIKVAQALRMKFPRTRLVICGDNDANETGQRAAREAARAVGGEVATPDLAGMDWNDVACQFGAEAVRAGIERACRVDGLIVRCMQSVQAARIRWLWPGRIPRGNVSFIAGHPGLGKSQASLSIAAIVSTGGQWPVDRQRCDRGNVIILSAEDDPASTIRPRLEAAGADLSRIHIIDAVTDGFNAAGVEVRRAFNLGADLARLGVLLERIGDVALIIIDPVSAYLGKIDSYRDAEARALLAPVAELAARFGVAVLGVAHLSKAAGTEALLRVQGSVAFAAAARAVWGVARDKEDQSRRLFLPLKNNLGKDETGLAFGVESYTSPGGIETSRVIWEDSVVTVSAEEAFAPPVNQEDRSELAEAQTFLSDLLADGPVSSKQVEADYHGAGFSRATILRAQKALGIVPHKVGLKGGWVWELPRSYSSESEGTHQKTVSNFGTNEYLRRPEVGATDSVAGDLEAEA